MTASAVVSGGEPMASDSKRFPMVFIVLPLVAVVGAVGAMGWSLYRDYQHSEYDEPEPPRSEAPPHPAAQREAPATVPAPAPVEQAAAEEDELGNLPRNAVKKAPRPAARTAAQRAYSEFSAAYAALEAKNESAVRKFRARKMQLDDQYNAGAPANEARFISDCEAARDQLREALRDPENR